MRLHFDRAPKPSDISESDWLSWTWQLRHSLKDIQSFSKWFHLSDSEKHGFESGSEIFNIRATPYYASLAGANPADPIRRILMPQVAELSAGRQSMLDPLGEKQNNPAPRIIHRYPDRILFLVTDICSVYCRYCTRKHFTGAEQAFIRESDYRRALDYIRSRTGVREVILSGGDPLTLSDQHLQRVLQDLRAIEHVEIIRIGTRMPVVSPMRVTESLVRVIRQAGPVFMMTHFNHPRELTMEAKMAVEMFVDHGIPVMNQMVLLNGINNHPAIVQALSRRLLYMRAKPYYMFQCDPSNGTDHLRTTVENSLAIQRELWGSLSGLAMPTLSLDIPNGGGKVTLAPDFHTAISTEKRSYRGWDGVEADYLNPAADQIEIPIDAALYEKEWNDTKGAKAAPIQTERLPEDAYV